MKNGSLRPLAVGAALLLCGCSKAPPNLVLITVDTLRADRLGAYGYKIPTSPEIDSLAEGGVRFSDASTTIPRTTQAIASLFTSRYPSQHGVLEIGERLHGNELTLAEILDDAGYHTVAISANPVASSRQGLDQGFEVFVDREDLTRRYQLAQRIDGPNPVMRGPAEAVTEEAIRQLESHDQGPFFLWLLYMDPHWMYNPPAPHNQVVDWTSFDFYGELRAFSPINPSVYFNLNGSSAKALPEVSRLYDAEIRYTDSEVGRLVAALRHRAVGDNTLVVVTSDHGESLGEHGYHYQHGALVYQPTMRIPLLFHLPGRVPEGRHIDLPVSIVDVAPTALALLGLEWPVGAAKSGRDLSRLWQPEKEPPPPSVPVSGESGSEVYPHNPIRHLGGRGSQRLRYARSGSLVIVSQDGETQLFDAAVDPYLKTDLSAELPEVAEKMLDKLEGTPYGAGRWRMVRDGPWKLIRIPELDGVRWELYDLDADPLETSDLSHHRPEELARMQKQLLSTIAGADSIRTGAAPAAVPEEVQLQLEALGYVDE